MKTWGGFAIQIADWGNRKGFQTPTNLKTEADRDAMLGKLALVFSEIAELIESKEAERQGGTGNSPEEFADIAIRILHLFGAFKMTVSFRPPSDYRPVVRGLARWCMDLGRAIEAVRRTDTDGLFMHLADLLWCVDTDAESEGIDVREEIARKMETNEGRPDRHGKDTSL